MKKLTSPAFAAALVLAGCVPPPAAMTPPAQAPAPAPAPAPSARAAAAAPAADPLASGAATLVGANPPVGGATMLSTRTIVQNAAAAPNLTTLTRAVQVAGLDATLAGPGPFTVFAPTDAAFGRLATGTVAALLQPQNKLSLVKVLSYHVIPGALTMDQLKARIAAGGGVARLITLEGSVLSITMQGAAIVLTDTNGNKAYVEIPDVRQSNGVVHVVNGVLSPKLT